LLLGLVGSVLLLASCTSADWYGVFVTWPPGSSMMAREFRYRARVDFQSSTRVFSDSDKTVSVRVLDASDRTLLHDSLALHCGPPVLAVTWVRWDDLTIAIFEDSVGAHPYADSSTTRSVAAVAQELGKQPIRVLRYRYDPNARVFVKAAGASSGTFDRVRYAAEDNTPSLLFVFLALPVLALGGVAVSTPDHALVRRLYANMPPERVRANGALLCGIGVLFLGLAVFAWFT
jgi:hypothetical protein